MAACVESGVGMVAIKALVNDSLPSNPDDVTEGYYRPSVEHLRRAIEQVTVFLTNRMARPAGKARALGRRSSTAWAGPDGRYGASEHRSGSRTQLVLQKAMRPSTFQTSGGRPNHPWYWLGFIGVDTLFIEPGSPWENGYVETRVFEDGNRDDPRSSAIA